MLGNHSAAPRDATSFWILLQHPASLPISTIAASTSAAATFNQRGSQNPVVSAPGGAGYGAIGSNKKWNSDAAVEDTSARQFGVISGTAMTSSAVNVPGRDSGHAVLLTIIVALV